MSQIEDLLRLYHSLCGHCDSLFEAALAKHPGEIECRRGCAGCCTIESVCALEAYVIKSFIEMERVSVKGSSAGASCVFLENGKCAIYPVRPVICRTHGLLLYNSEEKRLKSTCDLNFKFAADGGEGKVTAVDELNIARNLARLNLAFEKLTGNAVGSSRRIPLKEIANLFLRCGEGDRTI